MNPAESAKRKTLLLVVVGVAALALMAFAMVQSRDTVSVAPVTIDVEINPNITIRTLEDLAPDIGGDENVAPNFELVLANGDLFNLYDFLETDGRQVFLNLWASWCGPCRAEMPDIDAASARYPGVMFLGVAVNDDLGEAQAFIEEIGISYPIAYDTRDIVANTYPPVGMPATYIISSEGIIVETVFGQLAESDIDRLLAPVIGP